MNSLTRRSFLKATALATAATVASGGARAQANERIALAVIGCRNRGNQVASYSLASGQFDIVTLCDCDSAMADKGRDLIKDKLTTSPKYEKDFRRVLEDPEVDAVVVASPDHWHAGMAALALDAGKHVFLEKPTTWCIEEGKALLKAEAAHPGLKIFVGTQRRSAPHFAEAREFVRSGALGKIGFARGWVAHNREVLPIIPDSGPPATLDYDLWCGPAPFRPYNDNKVHYNWRFMRDYGTGETGNWGVHFLDLARWIMGLDLPTAVYGHGGMHVVKDAKEWPDTQTIVLEFPELTLVWEQRIWTKYGIGGQRDGVQIDAEKGSMLLSGNGWTFFPKDGEPQVHKGAAGDDVLHARNFADFIRGQAAPAAPLIEGHKSTALCLLGNIAVQAKARLEFDPQAQRFKDEAANAYLTREYRAPWKAPLA
ncbi:MAG: Gfo/Idh/MocA family oxidoreductase [FCB group bacterium]|jgi:predicted dehydrogenase|nr:Gfo/Idh/MocA family oxidoreductase [FCB group bacterium]